MLKLLKTPTESQLLNFLRKIKKVITNISQGETLLFPILVEGYEMMLILERISDRFFRAVIVQTDTDGLRYHSTNLQDYMIKYRNCLVINEIPKKNCLDDVFWMAIYNMTIHSHQGDLTKFYDILIPFLTGKSLETSLVEAEEIALKEKSSKDSSIYRGEYGLFRFPQCSQTAYVRCFLESWYYLLRKKGVSEITTLQVKDLEQYPLNA